MDKGFKMTYLSIKDKQEYIHENKEAEGIPVPNGTICFMLGENITEINGLVPNNFRDAENYYIVTECSLHRVFDREGHLMYESDKIHLVRHYIECLEFGED